MDGNLLPMLPTTSSLEQRAQNSRLALASPMVRPSEALSMARKLIGQFPNLRADQADVFIATVASVLGEYPLGVIEDCLNPRIGISRSVEWLSIEKLVTWCDARLTHHHALANYRPRQHTSIYAEGRTFTEAERLAAHEFMKNLAAELAENARRKWDAPRQEAAE